MLGYTLGPAIAAPLSEIYRRAIIYKTTFPVSIAFNLGAGLSQSFRTFLFCRFFVAVTASLALVVGVGKSS
jgi:MFS family permease